MAWCAALLFASGAYFFRRVGTVALAALSAALLSIPVAVLAFAFVLYGGGQVRTTALVVGCAVFPKLAQFLNQLFLRAASEPHVLTAHARGLGPVAVFLRHVAAPCAPEIAALAGVSLAFALSAAIPAEVVLDVAGIGQLAWQAALGRDLNLLVHVTMLMTALTVCANALAEWPSVRRKAAA
jgi:peptide/nickel transport system permease protein